MSRMVRSTAFGLLLLTVLVFPVAAQIGVGAESIKYPVHSLLENPCTGEVVTLDGTLHMVLHSWRDENGGIHFNVTENYANVVGIGATSGATYRVVVTEPSGYKFYFLPTTYPSESTRVVNQLLIAEGSATNAILQEILHVTVNANGETSVRVETERLFCQ